jgi:hypothetical protein
MGAGSSGVKHKPDHEITKGQKDEMKCKVDFYMISPFRDFVLSWFRDPVFVRVFALSR